MLSNDPTVTDTFDWAGLWQDTKYASKRGTPADDQDHLAAAYLRTRIEAAFVPVEEYRSTQETLVKMHARAEAAEARVKVLEEALRELQGYGCPVCNGDCGSANPPVISCPMQRITQAIRGQS